MGRNKTQTKKKIQSNLCLFGMSSNSVLLNAKDRFFLLTKMVKHLCFFRFISEGSVKRDLFFSNYKLRMRDIN